MQSRTPGALAQADARHNPLSRRPSRKARLDAQARARALKFPSYYRPHIPLLLADLACAVLVSATALFLPLCANYVTRQLGAVDDAPAALTQIYAIGGIMLGLLAVQVLAVQAGFVFFGMVPTGSFHPPEPPWKTQERFHGACYRALNRQLQL